MFTSFGVQYAGYIDMAHVGYDGTPVNERWFPNERLSEVFANTRDLARLVEDLGYDMLWTAEHHFQREGYECIPNVLLLNVYLAAQTTRLKLGCGFNITPMWHPCGWRKILLWPTSSLVAGSSSALAGATIRARWKPLGRRCWMARPIASCSKSR